MPFRPGYFLPKPASSGQSLSNHHINGSGKQTGTRIPVNGDGIAAAGSSGRRSVLSPNGVPTARRAGDSDANDGDQAEELHLSPAWRTSNEEEAADPEGQQQPSVDWERLVPVRQVHPGNGGSGNGKGGGSDAGAGNDGSGRERTTQVNRDSGAGE